MRQHLRPVVMTLLAAGLLAATAGAAWWVMGWQARDRFAATVKAEGWIQIGRFGDGWPARVRAQYDGYESLAFQRADGSRHEYTGFHGYRLRVVTLTAIDGSETIVVLRAAQKGRNGAELLPER